MVGCSIEYTAIVDTKSAHILRFRFKVRICPMGSVLLMEVCRAYARRWSGCSKNWSCYWSNLDYEWNLRINESPVVAVYLSAMLLKNMRNAMFANYVSQYFEREPPRLKAYLSSGLREIRGGAPVLRSGGGIVSQKNEDTLLKRNNKEFSTFRTLLWLRYGFQNEVEVL